MALTLPRKGLYAITPEDGRRTAEMIDKVAAAIRGGAVMVQYRAKQGADRTVALSLADLCHRMATPLIINDDPVLARDIGADGVHLGRDDISLAQARRRIGDDMIVGISCYNELPRAEAAARGGADYVAFGSFHPSRTKPYAVRAPLSLLIQAKRTLEVPIVAIGGITPENGAALLAAGADMLAVVDGVFGHCDPEAAARRYEALFR